MFFEASASKHKKNQKTNQKTNLKNNPKQKAPRRV
jgi:hypothetical protein